MSRTLPLLATIILATAAAAPAAAASTYLALGDSITFGETNLLYVPSYGDRGYVALLADSLAAGNGGARPNVVNLAIDGETASSFYAGSGRTPPVQGRTDPYLQAENLNYTAPTQTQSQLFQNTVASQRAAGNSIDTVTISLGFNELAALASVPNGVANIAPTLAAYRNNYASVLGDIRAALPDAQLYVLNYYNPFPADQGSPAAPIFDTGGMALNDLIRDLAAQFGATYVDDASAFLGHEAEYTYLDEQPHGSTVPDPYGGVLPIGNIHPNQAGYQAIFDSFGRSVAAVPETATWLEMMAGFALLGCAARRRPARVRFG